MSECAMGAGAITATMARVQLGARFSWPHLHSSLGVVVSASTEQQSYDRWAFLKPFDVSIWCVRTCTHDSPLLFPRCHGARVRGPEHTRTWQRSSVRQLCGCCWSVCRVAIVCSTVLTPIWISVVENVVQVRFY